MIRASVKNMDPLRLPRKILLFQLLTVSRLLFSLAFAMTLVLADDKPNILWICLGILVVAELTDILDGVIARRFGLVSEFGAMLDPYIDSLSRLLIYFALASNGLVLPFVPIVMALRDVTVAHLRIILTHRGRSVGAKWSGKIKATAQVTGAILAITGPLYWDFTGAWPIATISWVVIAVTVGSVIEYARTAFCR